MPTIRTTTYEHNVEGNLVKETVLVEEIPGGDVLRIDGLSDAEIAALVAVRDAFLAAR